DAIDVADRPQALASTQARVDRNPVTVGLDADGLQADVVYARTPAGGHEEAIAALLAPVVEFEDEVLAVASCGGGVHPEDELDAVAAQDLAQRFAQRCGLAGKRVFGALDEHRLAAQATHGLGHLHAD